MIFYIATILVIMGIPTATNAQATENSLTLPVIGAIENCSEFIINCITITKRTCKGIYETSGLIINPGSCATNLNFSIEENKPVLFTIIDGESRPIVLYHNGIAPNIIETVCIKNGVKKDPLYISLHEWSKKLLVSISHNLKILFCAWDQEGTTIPEKATTATQNFFYEEI